MSAAIETERAESVQMLRDSAGGLLPRGGDRARIRALRFKRPGFDRAVWREMGALGWIGLRVPEALGGAGLGMVEFCALAEAFGAALAPEPLVQAALSAALLSRAGAEGLLADVISGDRVVLTAWQEAAGQVTAMGTPDAPRLFVPFAAGADAFLVPVRRDGALRLLLQDAAGAELVLDDTQDGGHVGTLRPGAWLGDGAVLAGPDAAEALVDALDEAALGTAAVLLGVMDQAFALTLDYMRTRRQFGQPIGSFQALQHRAADLKVQLALTRASVEQAASVLDAAAGGGAGRAARQAAVSRAKVRAADAAMLVTRQAVQLHGAIGYTDEGDPGLYLRKAMVLCNQFGGAARHRRRFAALSPEDEA